MGEADLARAWVDPRAGLVTLTEYGRQWLATRTDLRARTGELYTSLLKLHIEPALGSVKIARIAPTTVRSWHAELSRDDAPGRATAARCYRLLRTIKNTAFTDEFLIKNPCQARPEPGSDGIGQGLRTIRVKTMCHRAELAWRSPSRLSRCRWCLPLEASRGETPQSFANVDSFFRRSGLSPAAARRSSKNTRPNSSSLGKNNGG
jgi:hypothetical protein